MTTLLPARDVIADALCRKDAGIPSSATFARADAVLAALVEAGWRLVPGAVWTVDRWHTPWVSHGSEVQAVFASAESAEARAAAWNAADGIVPLPEGEKGGCHAHEGEYTVERREVQP